MQTFFYLWYPSFSKFVGLVSGRTVYNTYSAVVDSAGVPQTGACVRPLFAAAPGARIEAGCSWAPMHGDSAAYAALVSRRTRLVTDGADVHGRGGMLDLLRTGALTAGTSLPLDTVATSLHSRGSVWPVGASLHAVQLRCPPHHNVFNYLFVPILTLKVRCIIPNSVLSVVPQPLQVGWIYWRSYGTCTHAFMHAISHL